MRQNLLLPLFFLVSSLPATSSADLVVLYDGDINNYTTVDQNFAGGVNAFNSTGLITPSGSYSGPTIYGGTELDDGHTSIGNFRVNNNNPNTASSDAIQWANFGVSGTVYGTFLFDATSDFKLESDSTFRLNARRTGGKNGAEAHVDTGIRWVVRDAASGDYYISALDDSNAAQYSSGYDDDWGVSTVTDNAPETLSWFNYDPAGTSVGTIGSSTTIDFASTSFDQGGFFYANSRTTTGGLAMEFAQFEVQATAVPEPSSSALLGAAGVGLFVTRKWRSRSAKKHRENQ